MSPIVCILEDSFFSAQEALDSLSPPRANDSTANHDIDTVGDLALRMQCEAIANDTPVVSWVHMLETFLIGGAWKGFVRPSFLEGFGFAMMARHKLRNLVVAFTKLVDGICKPTQMLSRHGAGSSEGCIALS